MEMPDFLTVSYFGIAQLSEDHVDQFKIPGGTVYVGTKNMISPVLQRNWDLNASLGQATNYKTTNFSTILKHNPVRWQLHVMKLKSFWWGQLFITVLCCLPGSWQRVLNLPCEGNISTTVLLSRERELNWSVLCNRTGLIGCNSQVVTHENIHSGNNFRLPVLNHTHRNPSIL